MGLWRPKKKNLTAECWSCNCTSKSYLPDSPTQPSVGPVTASGAARVSLFGVVAASDTCRDDACVSCVPANSCGFPSSSILPGTSRFPWHGLP